MKTTKKKSISTTSGWAVRYEQVVTDIAKKETPQERQIKVALYEQFQKVLNGKDLIFENSCK